jgi:hypothetical protein
MKLRITEVLKRTALVVLPALICGCTPETASGSAAFQDVQAFVADFGRQLIAALLL